MGNSWPIVEEAPHPSLIIWKNLGVGKINRCARSVVVSLIAAVLMAIAFFAITPIVDAN